MWNETVLTRALGIQYPIIQAPMAGGPTTPELVAAVSNAGGLGFLGAGYMSADSMRAAIHRIRELTDKPFGVNLFVPERDEQVDLTAVASMKDHLKRMVPHASGVADEIENVPIEQPSKDQFVKQLEVVLEERVPVCSFTFGHPTAEEIEELKSKDIYVIGTATTVEEATTLEKMNVDAIVVQGYEAGGHRGSFLGFDESRLIGSMALIPQVVDRVSVPVIAAGGIMDGRGIVACFALGASGVQMGTAFLVSRESGAHPEYKRAILNSRDVDTVITTAFSGKPARGIRNAFINSMQHYKGAIPPYPLQNALTRPIRNWASREANPDFMSLWAGQGSGLSREASAREIVRRLVQETEEILDRFTRIMIK